jgi:hypothetical protein
VISDNEEGSCVSTDAAISGDRNVTKKEAEKVLKYEEFVTQIERMWNVIPAVTGAAGTISKSLRQYLSNRPVKQEIKELQQTAILGTAHLLREVLM